MSLKDKAGMLLIKGAIKSMKKENLLSVLSITVEHEGKEETTSKEIEELIKKEWIGRGYDLKELADYLAFCRLDNKNKSFSSH